MKKTGLTATLFLAAILLGGCLSTIHPIFTDKDLVLETRLLGNWEKGKDNSRVTYRHPTAAELKTFSPGLQAQAAKIYVLEEINAKGGIQTFNYAFIVKLGKYNYVDIYPGETTAEQSANDFFAAHYTPMHSIYRIQSKDRNSFSMQQLDGGYLEKLIRNKQIRIKHEVMEDGGFVITAPTGELQQYLIKYGDVPEAYSKDNNDVYLRTN